MGGTSTGWVEISWLGIGVGGAAQEAFYRFETHLGAPLTVTASTPMAGPGESVNALDLAREPFDPTGTPAEFSSTGSLAHTAATDGTYTIRVLAENDTEGEYVLGVTWYTGDPLPFEVVTNDPADIQRVAASPRTLTVDFNDIVLIASLDASDLVIDGAPTMATAVTMFDHDTALFDLLPSLAASLHSVAIADVAVSDIQSMSIDAYAGVFYIDLAPPRVISSSIQENDVLPMRALTYTAQFDEDMEATPLDSADVELVGLISGAHAEEACPGEPRRQSCLYRSG